MELNKIILWAIFPVLVSCGNRKIGLAEMSPNPFMEITDKNGNIILKDSLKLTLKGSNKKSSSYVMKLQGCAGKTNLTITTINTSGSLLVDGKLGDIEIKNGNHTVNYTPSNITGNSLIVFQVKDEFDKMTSKKIEIVTFENLAPEAYMKVVPSGMFSDKEYKLDATGSFDRDAKFGGTITSYTFTINGKSFETVDGSPIASWIFGDKGKYNISVTVKDSDGGIGTYALPEPFLVN
ncbi:MAG: PKD domain-containing protein [Opitutaceae bacterium]|nr:PKD domain-containing protein [Cytophagales bacterium]